MPQSASCCRLCRAAVCVVPQTVSCCRLCRAAECVVRVCCASCANRHVLNEDRERVYFLEAVLFIVPLTTEDTCGRYCNMLFSTYMLFSTMARARDVALKCN